MASIPDQALQAIYARLGRMGSIGDIISVYFPDLIGKAAEDYGRLASWGSLSASATGQASDSPITIDNGSTFLLCELASYEVSAVGGTAEQAPPDFKLQLTNSSTSRTLFDNETPGALLFGSGGVAAQHKYELLRPIRFVGGSTITLTASNMSASARQLWVQLHGIRVMDYA